MDEDEAVSPNWAAYRDAQDVSDDDDAALQADTDASNLEEMGEWTGIGPALRQSAEEAVEQLRQQEHACSQVPWSPWLEGGE